MKSFNILICSGHSKMNYGGTETYCKEIKDLLNSLGHKCDELCYILKVNNSNISLKDENNYVFIDDHDFDIKFKKTFLYRLSRWNGKLSILARHVFENKVWQKKLKSLCNKNNYDLVIFNMNVLCSYKKIINKSISIQHSDYRFIFNQNTILKTLINSIFHIQNHFSQNKNIVCFTDSDKIMFQKKFRNKNIHVIPLFYKPIDKQVVIHNKSREKVVTFFSRYDNTVKNCDLIFNMFEKNKKKLLVISNDVPDNVKNKYHFVKFFNPLSRTSAIQKMRKNSLALIVISEYEGFPFTLVDSLSNGIPVIVRDSFHNAKFLANKNTGLLLPYKIDIQNYIRVINETDFSKFNADTIISFSEIFSLSIFKRKWLDMLNGLII